MAFQGISTGTGPNSGTGDTLLSGAVKINSNFTELYGALGLDGSGEATIEPDGVVTGILTVTGSTTLGNTLGDTLTVSGDINAGGTISAPIFDGTATTLANAANITTGTINVNRLGSSGTRDATTFLRGDNVRAVVDATKLLDTNGTTRAQATTSGVSVTGAVVAAAFTGDGSGLTNLSNDSLFSTVDSGIGTGIFPVNLLNVGIGTTRPDQNADLTVGAVGSSGTSLLVNGNARISGILTVSNVFVSGIVTATDFDINSSDGLINAGIVTTTVLNVGIGGTIITTVDSVGVGSVGIGSTQPTATLDINGHTKFKTYSENVAALSIASNEVTVDLSEAQSFTLTASDDVNAFVLTNPPSGSTSFTIKILQDSTGSRSVGIDTFKDTGGNSIPIYWPGGVVPIVTTTADKTDIYSFKTFDGDNVTSAGFYGVVGGQNFS